MILRGRPHPLRRTNPLLAVVNPLPRRLQTFADRLSPHERQEFLAAVAKYREFHGGALPHSVTRVGQTPGVTRRFLVGMGATEDVSYSVNAKGKYRGSNKRGVPFRHEFPSRPHMATTPRGDMIFIFNRATGPKFGVHDWVRG